MQGGLSSDQAGGKEMVDADPELEARLETVALKQFMMLEDRLPDIF